MPKKISTTWITLLLVSALFTAGCDDEPFLDDITLAVPITYDITLAVTSDSGALGALQFDVQHLGLSGGFVGRGGSVECTSLIDGALAMFNNVKFGKLRGAMISVQGFATPTAVAVCSFETSEPLSSGSFDVVVVEASDADINNDSGIVPLPTMAVVSVIRSDSLSSASTTSSTSTITRLTISITTTSTIMTMTTTTTPTF